MGIPDEPFWAPPTLVDAYRDARRRARRRSARRVAATARRRRASTTPRGTRAWHATAASTGWDDDLPDVRAGREGRHPRGDREGVQRQRSTACPGLVAGAADLTGNTGTKLDRSGSRSRSSTPAAARSTSASASTRWARRWSAWRMHGGILPGRRHVLRVPRLHAPAGAAGRARRAPRSCSCSPTTRSASARTARPTSRSSTSPRCGRSRSLQVIRPADANETVAAWRAAVAPRRPDRARAQPPEHPRSCTDGSRRRARRRRRPRRRRPAGGARRHRQRGRRCASTPPSSSPPTASRARVVSLPSWDRFEAQDAGVPRRASSRRRAGAVGRGRRHVRLGTATPTTRSASTASAPARPVTSCSTGSASTSTTWSSAPTPLVDCTTTDTEEHAWTVCTALYHEFGQSPWLDNLKRGYITSGQLADARRPRHPRPHLSNPTIFQKAIQGSADYDEQFSDARRRRATRSSTTTGRWCCTTSTARCDVFARVYHDEPTAATATSASRSTPASPTTAPAPRRPPATCTSDRTAAT